MSKPADQKPASAPKKDAKSNQPTLKELSPEQLGQVSGGLKVQLSDIHFVKVVDKASTN